MRTLFLIRHAKSSWDDTALPDKDRPLGDRGRRDAPKMGKRLAKRDVKPDLILSSPVRRYRCATEQRDELTSSQSIELHSVPLPAKAYRIGKDQSVGARTISQPAKAVRGRSGSI